MKYHYCIIFILLSTNIFSQNLDLSIGIGGLEDGSSQGIISDKDGNIIVVGAFQGLVDFDPGSNEELISSIDDTDLYIAKYRNNGELIWVKTVENASSNYNVKNCIAVDDNNDIYISGRFRGDIDFDPSNMVYNLSSLHNSDNYLLKLKSNGDFVWARNVIAGATTSEINHIHLTKNEDIILTGNVRGNALNMSGGFNDAFTYVLRLSNLGNTKWAKVFKGSNEYSRGYQTFTDSLGYIYIYGRFSERVDFNPNGGTYYLTPKNYGDIFLVKLTENGSLSWAKSYPIGACQRIYYDGISSKILIPGGLYETVNLPTIDGNKTFTSNGSSDICIVELNLDGIITKVAQIGGKGTDYPNGIMKNLCGDVILYGSFSDTVDFDPGPNSSIFHTDNLRSSFICKYKNEFEVDWLTNFSRSNGYYSSIDVNIDNSIISCGRFSDSLIINNEYTGIETKGNQDGFILNFKKCNFFLLKDTILTCDSMVWNDGVTYYEDTDSLIEKISSNLCCDTSRQVFLSIQKSTDSNNFYESCDSVTILDNTFYQSGIYTIQSTNSLGCDSTLYLNINIGSSYTPTDTISSCDDFTWNGQIYSESGFYEYSTLNALGCDSLATLDLTIHKSSNVLENTSSCDSFYWNGDLITDSGNYSFDGQNIFGCDSISNLNLTIYESSSSSTEVNACESYTWNGQTYTQSGLYEFITPNHYGCDSIIKLDLSIHNSTIDTFVHINCDSYYWNGNTYLQGGLYQYNSNDIYGCDSTSFLDLTLHFSDEVTIYETACDSFVYNNEIITKSGNYTFNHQTAKGCDSTVYLELKLLSNSNTNNVESCDSFFWHTDNKTYFNSGQHKAQLTNSYGCDSIQTLDLILNRSYYFDAKEEACQSYTWPINNETYTVSGQYNNMLTTAKGCDSIYTVDLVINPVYEQIDTISSDFEYTWQVNGETYKNSGIYTESLTTYNQCDSIQILILNIDNPAEIYVPNIITSGGSNTYFTIFGNKAIAQIEYLHVFDRWGNQVFNAKNILPNNSILGWDGKHNGQDVVSGVYVWKAKLKLSDGTYQHKSGDITVLK